MIISTVAVEAAPVIWTIGVSKEGSECYGIVKILNSAYTCVPLAAVDTSISQHPVEANILQGSHFEN